MVKGVSAVYKDAHSPADGFVDAQEGKGKVIRRFMVLKLEIPEEKALTYLESGCLREASEVTAAR